jgi:tetratricopeptide (TPR) repeat protein
VVVLRFNEKEKKKGAKMKNLYLLFFLMAIFAINGCGGGVIGTTGYQREYTPAHVALQQGWEEFKLGRYTNAIESFNNVLAYQHTTEQEVDAHVGLGYSKTRLTGITDAKEHFEKAKDFDKDAKIGMAGYWLSTAQKENMQKAIDLLTTIGLNAPDYVYQPVHDVGLNNAKAHALMAALYNYVGDLERAVAHAKKAKELNVPPKEPPYTSVTQIVTWVIGDANY